MFFMKGFFCFMMDMDEVLKRGFFLFFSKEGEMNFLVFVDYKEIFMGIIVEERVLMVWKIVEGFGVGVFCYFGYFYFFGGIGFNRRRGYMESFFELMEIFGFKRYVLMVEIFDEKGDFYNREYVLKFVEEYGFLVFIMDDVWKEFVRRK